MKLGNANVISLRALKKSLTRRSVARRKPRQRRRVKRWRAGDHLQRWVASALLKVESRFRRLKGHKEMTKLLSALDDYALQKGLVQQPKAA
jgi:hypothetical protein